MDKTVLIPKALFESIVLTQDRDADHCPNKDISSPWARRLLLSFLDVFAPNVGISSAEIVKQIHAGAWCL